MDLRVHLVDYMAARAPTQCRASRLQAVGFTPLPLESLFT